MGLSLNSAHVAKAFLELRDAAAACATLALMIGSRPGRSVRRGPAWPGGDQDERQRLHGGCDRAARERRQFGARREGILNA